MPPSGVSSSTRCRARTSASAPAIRGSSSPAREARARVRIAARQRPGSVDGDSAARKSPDTTTVNVADAQGQSLLRLAVVGVVLRRRLHRGRHGRAARQPHAGLRPRGAITRTWSEGGKRPRTTLSPDRRAARRPAVPRAEQPRRGQPGPAGPPGAAQHRRVQHAAAGGHRGAALQLAPPRGELRRPPAFSPRGSKMEDRIPAGVVEALRRLGHKVRASSARS